MALTQVDQGLLSSTAQYTGFKNRIINGAMVIDQRNAGAAVSVNNTLLYTVDRWIGDARGASGNGVISFQQSATAPTGFINSLSATLTTQRTSAASGDVFAIYQKIEGLNVSDFAWGTASAVSVTVSFWVRSSITGTYSGAVSNSAQNRSYPFTFAINSANTFEYKTITIPGDTTGTWLTTNGVGLWLYINLGCGSTYLGTANTWAAAAYLGVTGSTNWATGANNSTFYITGVQLEKGSTATSFDYRPYGTELALCQRYYQVFSGLYSEGYASGVQVRQNFPMSFPVQMRATPTRSVVTAGTYTNIRSSSSSYAGLGINGLTDTYASCSMESSSSGYMAFSNQKEAMSAEL